MENPNSWGPLEKAVADAAKHFYQTTAICDGPEPVELKASVMATRLIEQKAVTTKDQTALEAVIRTAFEMRMANPMPMISETLEVANAIRAAKLA